MILETTQMLVAAVIRHGANPDDMPYTKKGTPWKATHVNHPCTRWAGDTRDNFAWLGMLGLALCDEYTHRYGKVHSCVNALIRLGEMENIIPESILTPFPVAIADDKKCRQHPGFDELSTVDKYRAYYNYDKSYFCKWTNREVPEWFQPK